MKFTIFKILWAVKLTRMDYEFGMALLIGIINHEEYERGRVIFCFKSFFLDDPEIQEEIRRKDDKLLALLKEVYVDSRDPPVQVKDEGGIIPSKQQEYRLTKLGHLRDQDIPSIPKGKISVVEVLTLLNNHKLSPQTWTAEKIAKEYSIDLKEVTSLLEFFIPFAVEIFPPKDRKVL
uniref:NADH dehydrogenase [ubiquinone] 1 alpha subcomplex assembly factor 4 n=1 Tax=Gopherus agassizii TaxID=38772 RepID=A0A452HYZ7_9SAUR